MDLSTISRPQSKVTQMTLAGPDCGPLPTESLTMRTDGDSSTCEAQNGSGGCIFRNSSGRRASYSGHFQTCEV
jgi:hypothetical protein